MVGFTVLRLCPWGLDSGAQRLSASWSDSHAPARRVEPARKGAQRLSASWSDSQRRRVATTLKRICAQRLSASWSDSPASLCITVWWRLVLNAFRRHGRIHHVGRLRPLPRLLVLNAFRRHGRIHSGPARYSRPKRRGGAQRLSASWSDSPVDHQVFFGPVAVLNAFRRHGRIHNVCSENMYTVESCSTPFGVMVGFTALRRRGRDARDSAQRLSASWSDSLERQVRERVRPLCAQRLSASWSDSPAQQPLSAGPGGGCSTPFGVMVGFTCGAASAPSRSRQVLNAFRRHGRIHAMTPRAAEPNTSAQRLSASWSDSQRDDDQQYNAERVLNAFRRHGRIHLGHHRIDELRASQCSTPFGVMVGFT